MGQNALLTRNMPRAWSKHTLFQLNWSKPSRPRENKFEHMFYRQKNHGIMHLLSLDGPQKCHGSNKTEQQFFV